MPFPHSFLKRLLTQFPLKEESGTAQMQLWLSRWPTPSLEGIFLALEGLSLEIARPSLERVYAFFSKSLSVPLSGTC